MKKMFESIPGTKKYEMIINQLEDLILSKQLKKGDKLPSEVELMDALGVSRNSIREAISAMSAMGIVKRSVRNGTVISCDNVRGICRPLALTFMLDGGSIQDVLSFRYITEMQIVKLIIAKNSNKKLKTLDDILEKTAVSSTVEELFKLEMDFHHSLAELTENLLIVYFVDAIYYLVVEQLKATYNALLEARGNSFVELKKFIFDNHVEIVAAIKAHDQKRALENLAYGFEQAFPGHDFSLERLSI